MSPFARKAFWQATAILASVAIILVALVKQRQAPFDADTLRIQVSMLRSQASEAALLTAALHEGRVVPDFAHRHANQLRHGIDETRATLATKSVNADLAGTRTQVQMLASRLDGALQSDAMRNREAPGNGTVESRQEERYAGLSNRLHMLQARLKQNEFR